MTTDFLSFELPEPIIAGIQDAGFTTCTPIQEETLPISLRGRDVAGQAQTGTGKTAAFLIALFTRLLTNPDRRRKGVIAPRALVVAPTRELALQIHSDATLLGSHTDLNIQVAFGGVDYHKQRERLQSGVDVLIGTPGRLIDYYKQGVYGLDHVECLVIDEADRMFDMGFIKDIRYFVRHLPPAEKRQSSLYSATLSQQVLELAYESMNHPTMVAIAPEQVTAEGVEEVVYHVAKDEKFSLLLGLLDREKGKRILMFANMKHVAERLADRLVRQGYHARAITGDVDQRKRLRIMESFKEGGLHILVATDVASRGLHIEGVTHVINYDLPQDAEDYVHRIGRTARAGALGKALSLADEEWVLSLPMIEELIGHKIPVEWPDDTLFKTPVRSDVQGQPGRKSRGRRPTSETTTTAKPSGEARKKRHRPRRTKRPSTDAPAMPVPIIE
ncbi:MAG TPA: DEAD/DEAH box helicase [Candidatus Baltobacteraceae bacterium]|nr:DEAD/DEAH box helicase [Candidatus Baltobacteraceae bacterium]